MGSKSREADSLWSVNTALHQMSQFDSRSKSCFFVFLNLVANSECFKCQKSMDVAKCIEVFLF